MMHGLRWSFLWLHLSCFLLSVQYAVLFISFLSHEPCVHVDSE